MYSLSSRFEGVLVGALPAAGGAACGWWAQVCVKQAGGMGAGWTWSEF